MTVQDSIAFVSGVDRHGAKPPSGFPHRFAVLSWCDREGELAYPWLLYKAAIPRVAARVGAERVMAEYWYRQCTGIILRRIEETLVAEVAWDGLTHGDADTMARQTFPDRLRFLCGEDTKIITETEGWHMIGGPAPYHDSLTVSYFTAVPMGEEIQAIFIEEATKLGMRIGQVEAST